MEHFAKNHRALARFHDGALGSYMNLFADRLYERGYSSNSTRIQVRFAADFSIWLERNNIPVEEIGSGHTLRDFLAARKQRPKKDDSGALKRFLELLRQQGVIRDEVVRVPKPTPAEQLVEDFAHYLQQERALSSGTIYHYRKFASRFLSYRSLSTQAGLATLCAADVFDFVQSQAACLGRKQSQSMTCSLRAFLRYARYQGYIDIELAACVPTVPNWSMVSIPKSLSRDQVKRVLASCDRDTAIGRRDFAILLLLSRLGLRGGAIVSLKLEDIDWQAGRITVHGKGNQLQLPLPHDVGEALAAYLCDGRSRVSSKSVFLRTKAPIAGLTNANTVSNVVMRALARAGIDAPFKGAHQFRHTLATEMLRQGASLAEIGEVLGHRSPSTTAIYAKVDLASLHTLALSWPGGAQ